MSRYRVLGDTLVFNDGFERLVLYCRRQWTRVEVEDQLGDVFTVRCMTPEDSRDSETKLWVNSKELPDVLAWISNARVAPPWEILSIKDPTARRAAWDAWETETDRL